MSKYYVTTPIYYVNDLPHVGHIYTTVVCDTLARYHRMVGDDVYFLTGTDEHGQKIERAAAEQGVTPIELADRVVKRYTELWNELGITHDDLLRTSQERHHLAVGEMVRRIAERGDFYVDRHEGWYCSGCEAFYTEKELTEEKHCPVHERPAEWEAEENVFFRLSRYQDALIEWYDQDPSPVLPLSRRNEVRSFVEGGLRDLSVSRTKVEWGVPFPERPGHTVYVWLDALTNYLSALGFGSDDSKLFERYWEDVDGQRVHVIGKDILRFHAVYWPAFLMSAGLPLPTCVFAHGWWLRDERKMSKSIGNVTRPDHLVESFGADALRLFLLRDMVFGQDASFSDEAFVDRYNSDLANGLGNTLSRLVTLSRRAFEDRTPPKAAWDADLMTSANRSVEEYREGMEQYAFQRGLEALWRLLGETNQYLVSHEPWKLLEQPEERQHVAEVLATGLEVVRLVATALLPVLPETAPKVLVALGVEVVASSEALRWGGLPVDSPLPEGRSLFPRIDKKKFFAEVAAPPEAGSGAKEGSKGESAPPSAEPIPPIAPEISFDDFAGVDLRVADVKAAEEVPKSKKLLKLTLELDGVERTVVAGIKQQYTPEDLVGKQVIIVANLAPAKLMGIESQGMVLAASVGGAAVVLGTAQRVPSGTRVR
jgi:methionyl-tRNA synthetase